MPPQMLNEEKLSVFEIGNHPDSTRFFLKKNTQIERKPQLQIIRALFFPSPSVIVIVS